MNHAAEWVLGEARITLQDGVTLVGNAIRPAQGTCPVLLVRTPYPLTDLRFQVDVAEVTRRGLGIVMVNHRGTGNSTGTFEPWVDDAVDGHACIDWCATQPWSTGAVVTHGRSYVAQTQLYAAGTGHPALRAMSVEVCPSDPYDIVYTAGALRLGFAANWAVQQALLARATMNGGSQLEPSPADVGDPVETLLAQPSPSLGDLDPYFPHWGAWMGHPTRDSWWAQRALPDRTPIPTLFLAGWHDVFLANTIREFNRSPHPESRLIVGPWDHDNPKRALGAVDYGPSAGAGALDAATMDFLAAHAFGREEAPRPKVTYFVMGSNQWQTCDQWPPPKAAQRWHLASDGALSTAAPTSPGQAEFTFDPHHPTPTIGGANLFARGSAAEGAGSWDQRALDGRNDLVRFDTPPLASAVDAIGAVRVSLYASTTAADADWTAKLVDIGPDGRALNIADGIVRQRYASGALEPLPPGEVHRFDIELGPTAHCFLPDHRIRLEIASANFPRFDLNPGTGSSFITTPSDDYLTARQTIHFGPDQPSVLSFG